MNFTEFNEDFKAALEKNIIAEFDSLAESTKEFVELNFDTYLRITFENINTKQTPFSLNLESCLDFIKNAKQDKDDTKLTKKDSDGRNWWFNEIRFPFSTRMPNWPDFGTSKFMEYRAWRNDLEFKCEIEFWENEQNCKQYDQFVDLNIFDDKIIKQDEVDKYLSRKRVYIRKKIWLEYYTSLIVLFIPEFERSKEFSTAKIKRFSKPIGKGIYLGFEYDESELGYELARGRVDSPGYFNLILFNDKFDRDTPVDDYHRQKCSTIFSLGILGNPFLYPPCYSMIGYQIIDEDYAENEQKPYTNEIRRINETEFQIINSKTQNERLKKHAFFYMHLLSSTSKLYLLYLERVLSSTI